MHRCIHRYVPGPQRKCCSPGTNEPSPSESGAGPRSGAAAATGEPMMNALFPRSLALAPLLAAVAMAAAGDPGPSPAGPPAAQLLNVKGMVEVQRGSQTLTGRLLMALEAGDVVRVKSGGM